MGEPLRMSKAWAQPSAWTFTIKPIAELLSRYVPPDGKGWIDPYAGDNSPAEYTNDMNRERKAKWHLDSLEFCEEICQNGTQFQGILFDPPYSYRQVSEHYKQAGRKVRSIDTTSRFYSRVMNVVCDRIVPGGYAISFGWNTNGFGMKRGFQQVEILIVAHGGHHQDTLVTVEQKEYQPQSTAGSVRE